MSADTLIHAQLVVRLAEGGVEQARQSLAEQIMQELETPGGLTAREIADVLGITPQRVYQLAKRG